VTTARSLAVNDSGTTTFGGAIGSTTDGEKLTSITTDSAGAVAMNAGTVYTTGAQTYNDAVTLGADTTLYGVGINLGSTIKSNGTKRSLSVNDSGTTTFGGAIGSTTDGEKLTSITTDSAGAVAMNAGTVYTSAAQTYNDNVTLGADTTLTGSTTTTNGTLAGGTYGLTVTGNAVFGNGTADTLTGLSALSVSGTTAIYTNTITTAGTQTYTGAVSLANATVLTLTTTDSLVSFGSTLSNSLARALTVSSGSGGVGFSGAVGLGTALGAVILNNTGTSTISSTFASASLVTDAAGTTAINGGGITTSGTQTYNDNVTLGASAALTGTTITTNSTVVGGTYGLTVTGNAVFGNGTTDTLTGLSALSVSGTTSLYTDTVTTSGTQTYTGAVTLEASATLTTSDSAIGFASTVNGSVAGTYSLATRAGLAVTTFGNFVGNSATLSSLDIAGDAYLAASVSTSGSQYYGANVVLTSSSVGLSTTNSPVTIVGNVSVSVVVPIILKLFNTNSTDGSLARGSYAYSLDSGASYTSVINTDAANYTTTSASFGSLAYAYASSVGT
jgi:hypothetical protein